MAVGLATEPLRLEELKRRLAHNRLTAPLFDTRGHARHLEAAYAQIHERHHAGLPAEDAYVGGAS
jgi:predicted O-linked N-acetylglucosamine transferase (SPINDLY family)